MTKLQSITNRIIEQPIFSNAASCIDWLIKRRKFTSEHLAVIDKMYRHTLRSSEVGQMGSHLFHDLRRLTLLHRNGIHIFRPTPEMLEAAACTDPMIPASSFRLPFPSTVIQLPDSWGYQYGQDKPLVIITSVWDGMFAFDWHNANSTGFCGISMTNPKPLSVQIDGIAHSMQSEAIHRELWGNNPDAPELSECLVNPSVSAALLRIAVTCNLWLTTIGTTTSHLNTTQALRLKAKKRDRQTGKAARKELRQLPKEIRLLQEVKVRPLVLPRHDDVEPTGQKSRPHIRRGHWKMQACGTKWTDRRLIWVEPYVTGGLDPAVMSEVVTIHQNKMASSQSTTMSDRA